MNKFISKEDEQKEDEKWLRFITRAFILTFVFLAGIVVRGFFK